MEGSLPKHWHRIRFSYDRNNRLIRGWDDFGAEVRYDYDCLGNLTLEEQVIQEGIRRRVRYSYNKNGWRVKREETIQGNGETTSAVTGYEYDKSGNVTVIKTPNGFEIRRDYDADGQMTKERIIDRSNGFVSVLARDYDSAGILVRENIECREGEILQT